MSDVGAWWVFVVRHEVRELWRALPGPWWCKVALLVVTQVIPGPADDVALLAVLGYLRKRRAHRERSA